MPFDATTLSGHQLAAFTLGYVLVLLTPGPNLIVLVGVALIRGFRGSISICLGITVGSVLLAAVTAMAADVVPEGGSWDAAGRAVGGLLLLYVAWRLLRARPSGLADPSAFTGPSAPAPSPIRGDFALGFCTALLNPIIAAYFAGQFLTLRGERSLSDFVVVLALVGGITLLRSLIVAAVVSGLTIRTQSWRNNTQISRTAGALFAVAAFWLLASAAAGPDGVLAALRI